jgi:hypothetical protein
VSNASKAETSDGQEFEFVRGMQAGAQMEPAALTVSEISAYLET